jgi:hypothetical protein
MLAPYIHLGGKLADFSRYNRLGFVENCRMAVTQREQQAFDSAIKGRGTDASGI